MRIKKITISDYRGIREFSAEFPDGNTLVSGVNGCGKTTIATAVMDVLAKKDYDLHSDPDVFPDDGRECIPTVRIVFEDEDGTEFEVAKITKAKKLKPEQVAAGIKAPISNSYEVNSVPKNERDFKASLKEHGIDPDSVLPMMHPDVFCGQKWQDMRKTLFAMTTSHTEMEIAEATGDVDDVIMLLNKKLTLEEIQAQNKATYKLASEQCEAIPNQIIGAESTKKEVDAKALREELKAVQEEVRVILSGASAYDTEIAELDGAIVEQQSILDALDAEKHEEFSSSVTEAREAYEAAKKKYYDLEDEAQKLKRAINSKQMEADMLQGRVADLQQKYKDVKARTCVISAETIAKRKAERFDEKSAVCQYCGQALPKDKVSAMKTRFEKQRNAEVEEWTEELKEFEDEKKVHLAGLVASGKQACADRDNAKEDVAHLTEKYDGIVFMIPKAKEDADTAQEKLGHVESKVDEKHAEKRRAIVSNIEALSLKVREAERKKEQKIQEQHDKVEERQSRIEEIQNELDYVKLNREVDRRVRELNESLRKYGQQKADCERINDMLDRISRKKNELLSDEINSHFRIVRFNLFEYQKNGNYKECCTPMVKGADGEWREIGTAANTALSLLGKIDIAEGLQKFNGVNLPIVIDGAERFDNTSLSSIQSDRQLIFLAVANNPLTVSEV